MKRQGERERERWREKWREEGREEGRKKGSIRKKEGEERKSERKHSWHRSRKFTINLIPCLPYSNWRMIDCCMYLSINGDVPEVESSLSIHASEECGVDGGPLDVIDILIVVLKRAEWMACLALWRKEGKGRREEGQERKKGEKEGR